MNMNTALRRCGLVVLAGLVLFFAWRLPIDDAAQGQVKQDLTRSLKVFAIARALESGLSVVQSINVEIKLFGNGVGVSPGQVLRPVQQFVDRFAELMLAASVAFGIQLLLLQIGAHWVVSALLSAAVFMIVLAHWRQHGPPIRLLQAVLVFLLLVRFAVPLCVVANGLVYKTLMESEYEDAVKVLEQSPDTQPANAGHDGGVLKRIKEWFERMKDLSERVDAILKSADDWAARMVRLLALFAVQTIVLPLAFLWIFWRVCKSIVYSLAPARPLSLKA